MQCMNNNQLSLGTTFTVPYIYFSNNYITSALYVIAEVMLSTCSIFSTESSVRSLQTSKTVPASYYSYSFLFYALLLQFNIF